MLLIQKHCHFGAGQQAVVSRLISDISTYLLRWRKYQNLWVYDKVKICDRFVGHNASLARLDEKFLFYSQLVDELRLARPHQDLRGVRINLQPLIDAICEHARDWSATLGRILNEKTYTNLIAMKEHIQHLRLDLDRNIKGLSDFKTVMATIAIVQTTTLTVEMRIREMQETFSVLEEHHIAFEYTDMMMAYHLEKRWRKLYNSSMNRGLSLAPIKKKFADMTCVEIQTFSLDVCIRFESLPVIGEIFIQIRTSRLCYTSQHSWLHSWRPSKRKVRVPLVTIWIAASS